MDVNGILNLIEDKSGVLKFLIETMTKSEIVTDNLRKYVVSDTISNDAKIKALLEVTANQNVQISKLASLLLVYTSSDSFTSDVAKMAAKFGKGEEALQMMFKQKLKGNG